MVYRLESISNSRAGRTYTAMCTAVRASLSASSSSCSAQIWRTPTCPTSSLATRWRSVGAIRDGEQKAGAVTVAHAALEQFRPITHPRFPPQALKFGASVAQIRHAIELAGEELSVETDEAVLVEAWKILDLVGFWSLSRCACGSGGLGNTGSKDGPDRWLMPSTCTSLTTTAGIKKVHQGLCGGRRAGTGRAQRVGVGAHSAPPAAAQCSSSRGASEGTGARPGSTVCLGQAECGCPAHWGRRSRFLRKGCVPASETRHWKPRPAVMRLHIATHRDAPPPIT